MTDPTLEGLQRENAYLKQRNLQLQNDLADLSAENGRLRQERERLHGRVQRPNPLRDGQS